MVRVYPERPFFLDKGTKYLVDIKVLDFIRDILIDEKRKILQIGAGKGHISKILPGDPILVEIDYNHEKYLNSYKNVIWKNIFYIEPNQIKNCRVVVSNLPYNKAVKILLHCIKNYPFLEKYIVIIQEDMAKKMIESRSILYHKINHLFHVKYLKKIPNYCFQDPPKVDGALIELVPKVVVDWSYIAFLNSLNYPRKMLHYYGLDSKKRVSELDIDELYSLYLKFR